MAKIKFTKGELKRCRDALRQYLRYLPILQLKKQQLQMEILRQVSIIEQKEHIEMSKRHAIEAWSGLLTDPNVDMRSWVRPKNVVTDSKNIAGIDSPVFNHVEFISFEYDLFIVPLWVDNALEALKDLVSLREEINIIKTDIEILRQELHLTTQRVNLFEKVKIPESEEAIHLIKIYLGDQMANAVGRSKIAKRKIAIAEEEEILV